MSASGKGSQGGGCYKRVRRRAPSDLIIIFVSYVKFIRSTFDLFDVVTGARQQEALLIRVAMVAVMVTGKL